MENLTSKIKDYFSNKKLGIIFLVFIIILGAVFSIIFIPAYSSLRVLDSQLKRESGQLEQIKDEIGISSGIESRMVTDSEDIAKAIDELTKKASAFGFKFDLIKQGEPVAIGGNFKILPIAIESACSLQTLSNFIASLENLRQSVVVVDRIDVLKNQTIAPNLKVSLELGIYLAL